MTSFAHSLNDWSTQQPTKPVDDRQKMLRLDMKSVSSLKKRKKSNHQHERIGSKFESSLCVNTVQWLSKRHLTWWSGRWYLLNQTSPDSATNRSWCCRKKSSIRSISGWIEAVRTGTKFEYIIVNILLAAKTTSYLRTIIDFESNFVRLSNQP